MKPRPRQRIACEASLKKDSRLTLGGPQAHYLTHVLRLRTGDAVALFNGRDGEFPATLEAQDKKSVTLVVGECLRVPRAALDLWVCFAPIKGGRLETIVEKATELGASVLQPVLTRRTIVDKVNVERLSAIAREAAEQSERTDWPEIREPLKLPNLLADWPTDRPLIYGDESGESAPLSSLLPSLRGGGADAAIQSLPVAPTGLLRRDAPRNDGWKWAVLAGPEGGFAPEEFALLRRVHGAHGVGLGPRILRADTAAITLTALTASAWGDWDQRPRFEET
ncbi:MAG: 16S rRNA (uracil(1498)-N(3))-methyltransferase [Alphaproteobacteria bacterium]